MRRCRRGSRRESVVPYASFMICHRNLNLFVSVVPWRREGPGRGNVEPPGGHHAAENIGCTSVPERALVVSQRKLLCVAIGSRCAATAAQNRGRVHNFSVGAVGTLQKSRKS